MDKPVFLGEYTLPKPRVDFDFKLTSMVYNFSWWFNGSKLILVLDDCIVVVGEGRESLNAKIYSINGKRKDLDEVLRLVEYVLGLNEDLTEFYSIALRDPILNRVPLKLRGLHVRATNPWNAVLISVCQQNASFKQGWRMLYNIYKLMGREIVVEGTRTIIPPKPLDVLEHGVNALTRASVGYRAKTIIELAKLFAKKPELNTWEVSVGELEEELLGVKGVGSYTARLVLVLSKRYYKKPPIDRWLKKLIALAYKAEGREEEVYKSFWGKWSGLAALFTTIVLDAEPLTKAIKRLVEGRIEPDPNLISPLTLWKHL